MHDAGQAREAHERKDCEDKRKLLQRWSLKNAVVVVESVVEIEVGFEEQAGVVTADQVGFEAPEDGVVIEERAWHKTGLPKLG